MRTGSVNIVCKFLLTIHGVYVPIKKGRRIGARTHEYAR